MTDGIIQKEFFDFLARNYFKSNKGLVVSVEQVIAFKKELIEKIKEEIPTYGEPISREITYKILFGDNE